MSEVRETLEAAIEGAIALGGGEAVDEAIAVLDALDGEPDQEADEDFEPEAGEEGALPPLMDGGWGYGLGRLMTLCQCPCCGHRHHDGYVSPVIDIGSGT